MKIGPYQATARIGSGATASVYRAVAPDGRPVAVKVVAGAAAGGLDRALRELQLVASLSGTQGVMPVLDVVSLSFAVALVFPLASGGTLRDRLARGPLPVADALALGRVLARALGTAHERGIVHRDLKPENVLFSELGEPWIADFGLARFELASSLTGTGEVAGTPGYLAPEQLDDPRTAGPRADVFALGAILYEALTGRQPFDASGLLAYAGALRAGKPVPLRRLRPEVPARVERVILRALSVAPDDRHADGHALAQELIESARGGAAWPLRAGVAFLALVGLAFAATVALRPPPVAVAPLPPAPAKRRAPAVSSLAEAERAVAEFPEDALAWSRRANFRSGAGDVAGAAADLEHALRLDPKSSEVWESLATLRAGAKDFAAAEAAFARALELDPASGRAHANRAMVRSVQGDDAGARADLERAAALDPENPTVLFIRAQFRLRANELDGARDDLERALAKHAGDPQGWGLLAKARLGLGDAAGALEAASRATALDPRHAPAILTAVHAATALGRLEEARASAERLVEVAPRWPESWAARGVIRDRQGDAAGALADFERAIALGLKDPTLGFAQRRVAQLRGR